MYKNQHATTTVANNAVEVLLGLSILSAISGLSVVAHNPPIIEPYPINPTISIAIGILITLVIGFLFQKSRGASIYTIATTEIESNANAQPTISRQNLPPSYQNFMKEIISCDTVSRVTAHSLSDNSIGFKIVLESPIITPMMRLKMRWGVDHTYHRGNSNDMDGYVLWVRAY